jgi:hypothetical protein
VRHTYDFRSADLVVDLAEQAAAVGRAVAVAPDPHPAALLVRRGVLPGVCGLAASQKMASGAPTAASPASQPEAWRDTPASCPSAPKTRRRAMTPAWSRSAPRGPPAPPPGRHADQPRHPRPRIRLVKMATTPPGPRPMAPLPRPAPGRPHHLTILGRKEGRHVTNRDCSTGADALVKESLTQIVWARCFQSVGFAPAACTRTRIWLRPGSDRSSSASFSTSGAEHVLAHRAHRRLPCS